MTQDCSQHAYKRLQDRPKTAPSSHGASQGRPREAKILQKPKENQCFWPSRLFAFNGLLRPQDAPTMTQESPKRGPKEAQDRPKCVYERPRSGPSGPQEATFRAPTGGHRKMLLPVLIDGLQDGPKRPPRPPRRAPSGPAEPPKDAPERPKSFQNLWKISVQKRLKTGPKEAQHQMHFHVKG